MHHQIGRMGGDIVITCGSGRGNSRSHCGSLADALQNSKNMSPLCGGRKMVDSFMDRDLSIDVPDIFCGKIPSDGYHFLCPLEYSFSTEQFMHGADMLPGMVEGFQKFLDTQATFLDSIDKITFKEVTFSDLIYTILPVQNRVLQKESNVFGVITDNKGIKYHFYAQDVSRLGLQRNRLPICLDNKLCARLIFGTFSKENLNEFIKKIKSMGGCIDLSFKTPNIDEGAKEMYQQKMSGNVGYLLSTVLELVNKTCGHLIEKGGLVAKYDNLQWENSMDINKIFDGSMNLKIQLIDTPRIFDGNSRQKYEFCLQHDGDDLLKGSVTFWVSEDDSFGQSHP